MTVRLSAKLPPLEANGLAPIEEGLVRDPHERRIAIIRFDVGARFDPHADGEWEPQVRVIQVEVLSGDEKDDAIELMLSEYRRRTGAAQLWEPDEMQAGDDE